MCALNQKRLLAILVQNVMLKYTPENYIYLVWNGLHLLDSCVYCLLNTRSEAIKGKGKPPLKHFVGFSV